jgi:hypothetical protein
MGRTLAPIDPCFGCSLQHLRPVEFYSEFRAIGKPFLSGGFFAALMISDPEPIASELRSVPGVKDVDIVQFPSGKELWVVLKDPVEIDRLGRISQSLGCKVARRGLLVSKLPRSLAEMIWDGSTMMIIKNAQASGKRTFAARIMKNLVTGEMIYHTIDSDGLRILQEYLKS